MRNEHTFQFKASEIADAARAEAEYHESRIEFWQGEFDDSYARVAETIGAKIERRQVTGGDRAEVVIDYGDQAAYHRMQEADYKIAEHREAALRLRTDEQVYGTQGDRTYELDTSDVHYYRLGQPDREEEAVVPERRSAEGESGRRDRGR